MEEGNLSPLEEARKQLENARTVLASIQEANCRDGVWNEHVFHIESVAEKLVEKIEKEVAILGFSALARRDGTVMRLCFQGLEERTHPASKPWKSEQLPCVASQDFG